MADCSEDTLTVSRVAQRKKCSAGFTYVLARDHFIR